MSVCLEVLYQDEKPSNEGLAFKYIHAFKNICGQVEWCLPLTYGVASTVGKHFVQQEVEEERVQVDDHQYVYMGLLLSIHPPPQCKFKKKCILLSRLEEDLSKC
jgi:hypothetical protein